MDTPKYPQVNVNLVGEDGNAFSTLGRCRQAMKSSGIYTEELWQEFHDEATSADYNHLLQTVMKWFSVDGEGEEEDL